MFKFIKTLRTKKKIAKIMEDPIIIAALEQDECGDFINVMIRNRKDISK